MPQILVRVEGLEPSILAAIDFKSIMYTNSITLASNLYYTPIFN